MKKALLTVVAAMATFAMSALTESSQRIALRLGSDFSTGMEFPMEKITAAGGMRAQESSLSMEYTPAESPYTYTGLNEEKAGMMLAESFQLTPAVAQRFAGNEITAVFFYTGMNEVASTKDNIVNTIKKATLFLAEDLQDFKPFYTQTVDLPLDGLTLVSFELDTPYMIEADKPIYVGYYYALSSAKDNTLIVDAIDHGTDISGGWLGIKAAPTTDVPEPEWEFDNYSDQIGFFCLGAVITGDNLPKNEVSAKLLDTPQPTAYQGNEFGVEFTLQNDGANPVESIEVEVTVGNNEPVVETFSLQPLGYGKRAYGPFSGLSYDVPSIEQVPITLTITKVNGNPNNSATPTVTGEVQILPTGKGFMRNVLLEEFTGTWCGYCPQGIVTMEALRETYTDGDVIPVAVHNSDQMTSDTYSVVDRTYSTGYPSAVMNRQRYATIYPPEVCFDDIDNYMACPAPAKVTATAHFNSKKTGIIFDTKTSFTFDNDKASTDYILSFGITEDNVGPYAQNNGFAGTGNIPGWGDKPAKVETIYNDVARQYNTSRGITGSVPESVEYGVEYDFSYEMKFLAASKISNKDNLNAIVYLINRKNGVVENACMIKAAQLGGVDDVMADSEFDPNAPVEYYNLQGIRVEEPQNGLFIRRQGNNAKVVVVD